jgi:exonuclease SbcC
VRLVRLEARDFAQHGDLDLDLTSFDQAVVVGENGAGKSTLLDAVVWCLFGKGTDRARSTDELVRDDKPGMWVRTTWDRAGEEIVIQRTRSTETKAGESSLALKVAGRSLTQHTMGETQAVIERLVGLDREQLLAGPFMEQGQQDKLMRYDPGPRKALFASLCGADRFAEAHEAVKQWQAEVSLSLSQVAGRIPSLRERTDRELDLTRARDDAIAKRRTGEAAVAEIVDALDALRTEAEELRAQAVRAESLSERLTDLTARDEVLLREIEKQDRTMAQLREWLDVPLLEPDLVPEPDAIVLDGRLSALEEDAAQVASFRKLVASGEAAIAHHVESRERASREGLCDRCPYRGKDLDESEIGYISQRVEDGRAWLESHGDDAVEAQRLRSEHESREREIVLVRDGNAARVAAHAGAVAARDESTKRLADAEFFKEAHEKEREELREVIGAVQAQRLRLIQTDDRAKEVAAEMTAKAEHLTLSRQFLSQSEQALAVAESGLEDVRAASKELKALLDEEARLQGDLDGHALAARMLHRDGLPTMIVEATIPLVETRANELLERMPGEMMVELVTQKQTKAGTYRDTLDIVVSEAGRPRSYGMLSGGERFRVDLALRLGLSSVLLYRSGSKFETLWLDEPFAAQDTRALETLLQSIAAVVEEFGLTLLVTHQETVAERFATRIEVATGSLGAARVAVA